MTFDPFNLLLLAVALVVFWRLKSVLGTRTGNEKPPFDPMAGKRPGGEATKMSDADKKILRFPQADTENPAKPAEDAEPQAPVWSGYAEAGSATARGLEDLAEADPNFSPKTFVEGAKVAYEMVIDAFARGDKNSLRDLLSTDVFNGFARAIDERQAAGIRVESRFVGIDRADVRAASLNGTKARVTIEFVSELISATIGKSGEVIEGDPAQIREITDVWTFERDVTSRNPNWKLVATQTPA